MSRYVCQICGYVYDEAKEKVKFDDLPADWTCPLCGAPKAMFAKAPREAQVQPDPTKPELTVTPEAGERDEMRELSDGELAALMSGFARGCEKQYMAEEAGLFSELAVFFTARAKADGDFSSLGRGLADDLAHKFVSAKTAAQEVGDRGAGRALTWSEKVTAILNSLLSRYAKEGNALLEHTKIWVCEVCGFVFVGDVPPAICPICKVPGYKITEVARV